MTRKGGKAKLPKRPDMLQFLASQGGIRDEGGEMTVRDAQRKFIPGFGKLVRKGKGLPLDKARELAREAGYGNFESTNDFLDAVDRSLRGQRIFQEQQAGETLDAMEAQKAQQQRDQFQTPEDEKTYIENTYRHQARQYGIDEQGRDIDDVMFDIAERDAIQQTEAIIDNPFYEGQLEGNYANTYDELAWDIPFEEVSDADTRDVAESARVQSETAASDERPAIEPAAGTDGAREKSNPRAGTGDPVTETADRQDGAGNKKPRLTRDEVINLDTTPLKDFADSVGVKYSESVSDKPYAGGTSRYFHISDPNNNLRGLKLRYSDHPTGVDRASREANVNSIREGISEIEAFLRQSDSKERTKRQLQEDVLKAPDTATAARLLYEDYASEMARVVASKRSPLLDAPKGIGWEGLPRSERNSWKERARKLRKDKKYIADSTPSPTTERTRQGEQSVIPGAERISDKELAERKMREPKRASKPQKSAGEDGGLFDEGERSQGEIKFSISNAGKPLRSTWKPDFPNIFVSQSRSGMRIDQHPDYKAAKAGDVNAGFNLVNDAISESVAESLRKLVRGKNAVLAPVIAREATGNNTLPLSYAEALSDRLGLHIDENISQVNKTFHTGADSIHRIVSRAKFDGAVEKGRNYILVDDHVAMGGTLADLKGYIEANGGNVIAATTLTAAKDNPRLALDPERLSMLKQQHGSIEKWWNETFGNGYESLTNAEARQLLAIKSPDTLRAKILAGMEKASARTSEGASQTGVSYGLSPQFQAKQDKVKLNVLRIAQRMNPSVKVSIVDRLFGEGQRLLASGATSAERQEVAGSYNAAKNLITVSLNRGNPEGTAFHEAWHSIESMLTDQERKILEKAYPEDDMSHDEITAYAFQDWAEKRFDKSHTPAVRRIFAKVREFIRSLGNLLRGYGFDSVDKIFERAASGEVGGRFLDGAIKYGSEPSPERVAVDKADDEKYSLPRPDIRKDNAKEFEIIGRITEGRSDENWLDALKSLPQRARDVFDDIKSGNALALKTAALDQFAALEAKEVERFGALLDASVSAYKFARVTKGNPKLFQLAMGVKTGKGWLGGQIRYNAEKGMTEIAPGTRPLMAIFEPIAEQGAEMVRLWEGWAIANRAQRLMKEGRENLLTQEEIDALLPLEKKYPLFRTVMDEWTAYNKAALDMAEQAGLISKDSRTLWESNDYVPFYRVMEDESAVKAPFSKGGLQGQRSGIKTLKGGTEKLGSIIENMMRNATHLMDASVKNIAMQRIDALYEDADAWESVGKEFKPVSISAQEAANKLFDMGVDVEHMSASLKNQWMTLFQMQPPKDKDVISFMVDGKPQYRRVKDPLLMTAITNLGGERIGWLMTMLSAPKRWLTAGVTSTPTFMARNAIRDTTSTMITTQADAKHPLRAAQAFVKSLRNDPAKIRMLAGGAGFYGYYQASPAKFAKQLDALGKKRSLLSTPAQLWEAWQAVGEASEQMNRLALYESLIEQGVGEAEAAYQARDLLDFQMQGVNPVVRFFLQTVPFLNPRLQGLYKLMRAYRDSPVEKRKILLGKAAKNFTARGALLMAASIALWALNKDDERYKDLQDWDKDTNYHLWLNDTHFTIPKPFEVGAIFSTIPERVLNSIAGIDRPAR